MVEKRLGSTIRSRRMSFVRETEGLDNGGDMRTGECEDSSSLEPKDGPGETRGRLSLSGTVVFFAERLLPERRLAMVEMEKRV